MKWPVGKEPEDAEVSRGPRLPSAPARSVLSRDQAAIPPQDRILVWRRVCSETGHACRLSIF